MVSDTALSRLEYWVQVPSESFFMQGDAMFDKRLPMVEYQNNIKEHLRKGQMVSPVRFVIINAEIGIG